MHYKSHIHIFFHFHKRMRRGSSTEELYSLLKIIVGLFWEVALLLYAETPVSAQCFPIAVFCIPPCIPQRPAYFYVMNII